MKHRPNLPLFGQTKGRTFGFTDKLLTSAGTLALRHHPENGQLTGTSAGLVEDSWQYDPLRHAGRLHRHGRRPAAAEPALHP
jgi:hypothetical protein